MKRLVSIVVGSAALMCGAASVTTATFEEIASDAQVVTAVDLSGLASEAALAGAAEAGTNYVDAATNAVVTSVEKKGYLTSESDPAWTAWTNKPNVALGGSATAVGYGSTAVGGDSAASEAESTAVGFFTKASGYHSTALGYSATAVGGFSTAVGDSSTALGVSATAVGYSSMASGEYSTALGYMAYAPAESLGLAYTPETILLCSSNTTKNAGSTARSLRSYLDEKADVSAIPDVSKFITADAISAADATFSNAVLAVGLNIDTDTLAAINELATIDYTTPATTVGALLAALAAGLAALKKKTATIETKVDAANTALEEVA